MDDDERKTDTRGVDDGLLVEYLQNKEAGSRYLQWDFADVKKMFAADRTLRVCTSLQHLRVLLEYADVSCGNRCETCFEPRTTFSWELGSGVGKQAHFLRSTCSRLKDGG